MIPNQMLRNDISRVIKSCQHRGSDIDFEQYASLEEERKVLQVQTEQLQAQSNQLSKDVAQKKANKEDCTSLLKDLGKLSKEKKEAEASLRQLRERMQSFELAIPNVLDEDVPVGDSEANNQVIDQYGEIPGFAFDIKSHADLGVESGGLDFTTAANMSGSRFVLMKGKTARLHRALAQWMLDRQIEKGYLEVNPPLLAEPKAFLGTGQLPKFAEDQFFCEGGKLALIPTAEVTLTNMVRESIVPLDSLPMNLTALTPCFRKEAGAYGKDTQGLIRLHQFEKVEMVRLVTAQQAKEAFDALIEDACDILKALNLPYQKVLLCSGDTGFSSTKTYDLEVWMPSENQYREISSCSYFGDFQARRMGARYRDASGKTQYLHTLNGSGLAVGRTLAAVMEHYQLESGNISIPDVIRPYMAGVSEI